MVFGNSRKWIAGSLFVLACVVIARASWAADEAPNGGSLQPVPAETPTTGSPSEPVLNHEPSATPAPAAGEEDSTTFCEMPLCSPPGRFWLRTDALLWWTSGTHLPPLVTSNSSGAPVGGQVGTQVLFGNNIYMADGRGGVRTTMGFWLDRCHRWGIEADWFTLAGHSVDFSNFSNGNPATGRPFYNVETNRHDAEIVAQGAISGFVGVTGGDAFDSAGFLVRYNLCCGSGCGPCGGCNSCSGSDCGGEGCATDPCSMNYCRTDFLFGYRHYALNDGLTIHESLDDRTPGINLHSEIYDNFKTSNNFNGAELGLTTEVRRGSWSFNILTKMAFGMNHQTTNIYGTTAFTDLNGVLPPSNFPVGIFAGPTNGGTYTQDTFVVIPQLGFELGYQVTNCTRAYLGYNLLYWGNVLRAGDQIDENVDPRNWAQAQDAANALPFPAFPNRSANFWAQGINLGLEVRF